MTSYASPAPLAPLAPFVRLDAHGQCLILDLRSGTCDLAYIGCPLPLGEDLAALCDMQRRGPHGSQPDQPGQRCLLPHSGWGDAAPPALVVQRDNRPLTPRLVLVAAEQLDPAQVLLINRDETSAIDVTIGVTIMAGGVIRFAVRVTNHAAQPLGLVSVASLVLPLPSWASHVRRYAGRWTAEMQQHHQPIHQGVIASMSSGGRPGFGGGQWVRIESREVTEQYGLALAAHLAWSGDHLLSVERNADGDAMLMMAARLEPGEIILQQGESFAAPHAFVTVSTSGIAAVRHAFHDHVRDHVIPSSAASTARTERTVRKVHLNSWEALGFDQSESRLMALADNAAALGVERFVLDDGWFAGRRDDTTSLGDWRADPGIFPEGLGPLITHVQALGMDFGLWVEPEMVSPDSDLYRAHPDWCLQLAGQPRPTQRNQLVLDLTQPIVAAHVFAQLDRLLSEHPVAYLKWDHNRDLFPLAGKGHGQVLGLYALLDRLRAAHPHVEIETCASGGGRVDFEMLRRCSRFWASDNNDPIERLKINSGWFDFLPMCIAGNHVGPSPNPITGRNTVMNFRAKVALFGHMGVEADPGAMSAADRDCLAAHITLYKHWRDVLHFGTVWQLMPQGDGLYAMLAMTSDKGLALIAQTVQPGAYDVPHIRFAGLDDAALYRIKLLEPWPDGALARLHRADLYTGANILSGKALRLVGISLPLLRPETAWLVSVERYRQD